MRYGTKHAVWTPFLTPEEREEYRQHLSARRWLYERMKNHEDAIARLEIKGRRRRTEAQVREAVE